MEQSPLENVSPTLKLAEGLVVELDNEGIWVETARQGGCDGCGAQKTCGTSALASMFSPKSPLIKVENTLGAKVGDRVVLSLDESDLIKHSFMAYGIPLLVMFIFSGVAQVLLLPLFQSDFVVVVAALFGLLFGWLMTQRCYQPVLPNLEKILYSDQPEQTQPNQTNL